MIEEPEEQYTMRNIPSSILVQEMTIGWNLGNTFDATAETLYGNPVTTKEFLAFVKSSGFNTIRIPITWESHFEEAPEYLIEEAWISRIQIVVDDAIDLGFFVIINMHHERWNNATYENLDNTKTILRALWTQIGTRFEDYSEFLLFESMNEVRIYGDISQWRDGTEESRDVINQINQEFVDVIRGLGGNNPIRHLVIPTHAAKFTETIMRDFIVPDDNKIIVSIHAYVPVPFAHDKNDITTWNEWKLTDTKDIEPMFSALSNQFVTKGIPVIMGEFGARDKNNESYRAAWAKYYVEQANYYQIKCLWWDTGISSTGHNFALFDRRNLTVLYPDIIQALMDGIS
jgi:endoglucanase